MDWIEIDSEEAIKEIQRVFGDFLDAIVVRFEFESGNYIDKDLVGHECMINKLHIYFQRMDRAPFAIEVEFEGMRRINFYASMVDEYAASIIYAKFAKNDQYIYWTKWREFDPYNQEHLKMDFTFVEAKKARWRVLE